MIWMILAFVVGVMCGGLLIKTYDRKYEDNLLHILQKGYFENRLLSRLSRFLFEKKDKTYEVLVDKTVFTVYLDDNQNLMYRKKNNATA